MEGLRRFTNIVSEIDALYHEAAVRCGLSDSAMTVLYATLDAGGRCEISAIVRSTGIRKQTLNSALRKFETEGIVRLERGAGRTKVVVLTREGLALAKDTAGCLRRAEDEALACWSQEEMESFLSLATRFQDCFSELVHEMPQTARNGGVA